ncbi:vWA domain-containing protein [Alteromonas oceanisediminis]|uniref:vWA domain-containing protein n=1 Tax=Alteromonas oceanisediminis TaxID=2836180 RepID=UPI001BDA3D4B|nr:VWA domain-containing protein [Alteromonas oceanisediminis]MBT0587149.1 VWA domain-containing protein [Alteromonas oceanisediminis]
MLIDFFFTLKRYRLNVSLRELLDLISALEQHVVYADMEAFYFLARMVMIKDESQYDKFDRAFADYFKGVQSVDLFSNNIPQDWLNNALSKHLSDEEKAKIKALGGLDKLMETLQERLKEQEKRHQGGNKWIGTGGTSPFGANGYNPEGIRVGQKGNRNFSAVKVWEKREFRNFSSDTELGTRSLKMALRKLRKFARTGASEELDVNQTIGATAKNGGMLDIHMAPERHNAVKVLMFFDVGGSMDAYIEQCQELFSAVHSEFKHLEYFYFHNCVYENVWKDNARRDRERMSVWEILHKYGRDYKVIFVGDATMGPYEVTYPGGSIEHWNEEPGSAWIERITSHFNHVIWLNPQSEAHWQYYASIQVISQLMQQRMYPLTLDGLSRGIKALTSKKV